MNNAPTAETTPGPEPRSLATRHLGGLFDLLFFLLAALGLFLSVQLAAVYFLALRARADAPDLPWAKLIEQIVLRHQFDAFFAIPVQLVYYLFLLLLLFALVRGRRGLPFWSSLAMRPLPWGLVFPVLAGGALLALLVNLASVLVPPPESLAIDRLFTSRAAALLIVGASLLPAPFVEELVFRGYIFTLLERLWGSTAAVLTTGFLFGAIHFPQLWPGYFQMLLLCFVGIIFSLARAKTGTTLASILLHFGYNASISFFILTSSTFRDLPASF